MASSALEKTARASVGIVGGSGFVGRSVAQQMSSQFDVTVLDRAKPEGFTVPFRFCDIREPHSLPEALRGFDVVVNSAIVQLPEINQKKRLGYEVNVLGVQNLCEAVESIGSIRAMLHTSSWHIFGERDFHGVLNEESGFRPDKIEERARFYALCKIAQESVIRIIAETSNKQYGIIRLGTVLGERMPQQTAANLFIENSLNGKPMTPFKHTQHRPMLYVDINDVSKAFQELATRALNESTPTQKPRIVNMLTPHPVTIIELARLVQQKVLQLSKGRVKPKVEVIDKGMKSLYRPQDKRSFKVDISKAQELLGRKKLVTPPESIERIIRTRMSPP